MEEYEEAVQLFVEHLNSALAALGKMTEVTGVPIGIDMMIAQRIIWTRDDFKQRYGFLD